LASWKAKKGNPFEKLIAYNLMLLGYDVQRIDDNTKGIDLIAKIENNTFIIECKFHKKFSWNDIEKILNKTNKETIIKFPKETDNEYFIPIFVFKSNQQPILVAYHDGQYHMRICTFHTFFNINYNQKIERIPKGYKVWKKE
jgi:Holliday junction resolvase